MRAGQRADRITAADARIHRARSSAPVGAASAATGISGPDACPSYPRAPVAAGAAAAGGRSASARSRPAFAVRALSEWGNGGAWSPAAPTRSIRGSDARPTPGARRDNIDRTLAAVGQRGFSLLEILLVMALIAATGLLAAGVLTGGFDRMTLNSGAKELAAQIRFARAHAIATGQPQRFTIDPATRTWQGANGRGGELPSKLEVRFTGAREVQPREDVGAIVFFGDGASTGGRLQLSLRDAAWNVDVAWLTGEVTLRRGEVGR